MADDDDERPPRGRARENDWAQSSATQRALEREIEERLGRENEQRIKDRRASLDDFFNRLGYQTDTSDGFENLRKDLQHARNDRIATEKTAADLRKGIWSLLGFVVTGFLVWLGSTVWPAIQHAITGGK